MEQQLPIVVGTDGSDFANIALKRAFWLANQVQTELHVIRAWSISTTPRPSTWAPGFVPPADDFEAVVRERLERDLEPFKAEFPDVTVRALTPHGPAGKELIKASEGALVLVVGGRGQGGFRGLLMGSNSNQVVEHAKCDVLVVRRGTEEASPDRRVPLDRLLDQ